ncbi:MAG TPA: VOC family protein [Azonexus sp.]|nr:VOC family protein [Azonexus sp.]
MNHPSFILLYVGSPAASAAFYADLLGSRPVEASSTFALFALDRGMMLGLWARGAVEPGVSAAAGSGELAFAVDSASLVDNRCAEWAARGIPIAQPPTRMDFGYTFVGLDPDGHRLRVFAPSQP